jgi:hypothetical protein
MIRGKRGKEEESLQWKHTEAAAANRWGGRAGSCMSQICTNARRNCRHAGREAGGRGEEEREGKGREGEKEGRR